MLQLQAGAPRAETRISLDVFGGMAANAPTSLTIQQDGEPSLELTARYDTKAFEPPLYYAVRVSLRHPGRAWEVQFLHHKLLLSNPPDEVQSLEITHGFNIITLNYALETRPLTLRLGGGLVMPHVSGEVRNRQFSSRDGLLGSGYRLTGPALLLGAGKRHPLSSHISVNAEAQVTGAWTRTDVGGGSIRTSNVALHVLVGIGYSLRAGG
jgi:hypothetical protein